VWLASLAIHSRIEEQGGFLEDQRDFSDEPTETMLASVAASLKGGVANV
jgi:hypothetical protein